jgi:hypothetical protein
MGDESVRHLFFMKDAHSNRGATANREQEQELWNPTSLAG